MADVTLTLYGATGVSTVTPRFDFTSGTVKVYVEEGYVKDLTSGVEDSIALAVGEKLEYVCSNWDAITRIDINSDKVSGDISGWVLPATLVTFYVYNTGVSGDISGWVLPATLVNFYVNSTSVSGDISGWVLPATLVTFYVNSTSVSGDISGWVLPATLVNFYVSTTGVSGDISGWVLPAGLVDFRVFTTGVSGDISGWVLPAGLVDFYVYTTGLSGDISGWVWTALIYRLYIYGTLIDYDFAAGAFTGVTNALQKIDFDNCALTQAQVDNVLVDLVASGITSVPNPKALDLAGTNAAPSAAGLLDKATLIARGWVVVTN